MKKNLHILFLCGWYPSKVLPKNGDFIMRHAKTVSSKHTVSVLHIISKIGLLNTEIEVEKDLLPSSFSLSFLIDPSLIDNLKFEPDAVMTSLKYAYSWLE